MGFNTTVIVMNDAFHQIEEDKDFGKKLVQAAHERYSYGSRVRGTDAGYTDISAGSHVNAASVIGVHHADSMHVFAIGGNTGYDFGRVGHYRSEEEEMMRAWANKLGFDVHKKRKTP